ncbi:T-cell surface glycoprotein CD3 epsilon chain [Sander lucioperca]|uniref:T-cell surface glycoprotein CD3 epsilon chain n=1 Tax=Sander lucioperca TaxID=283035 RepID=UPI00125D0532|nr:T-cell surface glycoprotein CD3 epsilon chain [Sander lucioperca]XP_035857291.1 T-cell surface glycoprotein CD3 epsilon chain [Sander lucioperca]
MNSMGVRATLAVLLLFIATVKAAEGGVTFWRETFTMTCPENGKWFREAKESDYIGETYTQNYDTKSKGLYHCEYTDGEGSESKKYYFYVKGKACKNCFELDSYVVGLAIVVDVLGTAFVMMVIYRYTKKKYSAGLSQASKAPARSAGRHQAPSAPPVDYEPLNLHTRAQDAYDVVNRNG